MSDKLIYTPARAKRLILEKKLPKGATVSGSLYLGGCDLSGVTSWWKQGGEEPARRCIAVSDYALIQTETGQYTAGCRGPWSQSEALAHWGAAHRKDARAKAFVAAIKANPAPIAETAA